MAESVPPADLPAPGRGARRFVWVAIAVAVFFGAWIHFGNAFLDPTARDQDHDLGLAIRIREGTSLSDGNRHPLLPACLAPLARREPAFFDDARIVGAVLAGLVVLGMFLATSRVYGRGLALVAVLGVLLEVRLQARRIAPEPLVAACLVAAASWAATAAAARRPALAHLVAGGWLGAAWLTKGSALLSLLATLVVVARAGGRRGVARVGLVVAGFVVVASPLLAWNVSQGRSPVYNVNSAHVMWERDWDEELDQRSEATPVSWWAEHGLVGSVRRLENGLTDQRGVEWVYGFLGVVGLSIAAAAVRRRQAAADAGADLAAARFDDPGLDDPRRAWLRLAFVSAIAWLLAMAWYAPIVSSRRLLFPIFPVLLPPALDVIACEARRHGPALSAKAERIGTALAAVALVPLFGLALKAATAAAKSPAETVGWVAFDASSMAAVDAIETLVPRGSRVLMRPSRTRPPDWLLEGHVQFVALPRAVADADVPRWAAAETDVVLLNEGLLAHRPAAFASVARWDDAKGLVLTEPPGLGPPRWVDPAPRSRYALVPASWLRGGR